MNEKIKICYRMSVLYTERNAEMLDELYYSFEDIARACVKAGWYGSQGIPHVFVQPSNDSDNMFVISANLYIKKLEQSKKITHEQFLKYKKQIAKHKEKIKDYSWDLRMKG